MKMQTFEVKEKTTGKVKQCVALIRKLTERECFRLMDVDDADIDKIQASGVCRSEQYKLAGNSICVGVLTAIFEKALIRKGNDNPQMTIFDVL